MSASTRREPGATLAALAQLVRSFGREAARAKHACLTRLAGQPAPRPAELVRLQELLLFLLAQPDDRRVHAAALALVPRLRVWAEASSAKARAALRDSGLAGSTTVDTYGYPLLRRLCARFPGELELEWDELEDTGPLQMAVARLLEGAEVPGIDDISLDWDDWLAACRTRPGQRDLELLLELFAQAPLTPAEREWRFDGCGVPVSWRHGAAGSARAELRWPHARVAFRTRAPAPWKAPIAPLVRRPLVRRTRLGRVAGERFLDFAAGALAARQSEIRPLSYGNPEDVTLAECGAGLCVALIGVVPGYREALESLYTALLLQNGVPIAYGPASVSAGCCELGLNLFEEFRGFETRRLYAQYMRVVHHVLGARYFFLTPYGMGRGNPEALRAGSFWFYRRLGFRPTSAAVEGLARVEEARLHAHPGSRSDVRTLRRLAETAAWFDLSRGACRPLPLGPIGLAVTRRILTQHGGERERARRHDARAAARALELGAGVPRATLELLGPLLMLDPGLGRVRAERTHLARFVRAKAAPAEGGADAHLAGCPRFLAALRAAAAALRPDGGAAAD